MSASPVGRQAQPQSATRRFGTELLLRTLGAAAKFYFRHMPGRLGKAALWDRVVQPYLAWRPMEIEAKLRFGACFAGPLDDAVHRFAYFFGVFEPAVTAVFETTLRPGDVAIDIGANVGVHTA